MNAFPLTFDELHRVNLERALRWHPEGLDSWSTSDWYTATAGELGELNAEFLKMGDTIKKMNRFRDDIHSANSGGSLEVLRQKAKDEIGDVCAYLDLLATRMNLRLEDCIRDKFNKISEREGFPERL